MPFEVEGRRLYRAEDVQKIMSLSKATVYRWIQRGIIPSVMLNGVIRVPVDEFERWYQTHVTEQVEHGFEHQERKAS